jgi:competence protein ComEC
MRGRMNLRELHRRWPAGAVLCLGLLLAGCPEPAERQGDLAVARPAVDAASPPIHTAEAGAAAADSAAMLFAPDTAALVIKFLDVGQGDAVLIRAPTGQTVLYDGGDRGTQLSEYLRRRGIERLDLVIASHNHADHIGGLPDVVRELRPRFVMENGLTHTTRTYERFLEAIHSAGSQLLEPEQRSIRLGEAELVVLPPPGRASWGHNENSVGIVIVFGAFRASLGGDAERRQFDWWLDQHPSLMRPVHVHKASHHGSRNGDTEAALAALRPEVVVIGVAADNRYGHPHQEALALYEGVGARVYRTDLHGSVRIDAHRDGSYSVQTERASVPRSGRSAEVD